jgi:hypothetical protein
MPSTIRLHRVFKTTPERLYKAFINPEAMVKWLPPNGFTGKVDKSDVRVGGSYHMSFTNFTDRIEPLVRRRIPGAGPRQEDRAHRPLRRGPRRHDDRHHRDQEGAGGLRAQRHAGGRADAIPAEACYLGWGESLDLLKMLVEPEIPDQH